MGVNVGGNLVALTGNLEVSAAGDVKITPSGTMRRRVMCAWPPVAMWRSKARAGAGAVALTAAATWRGAVSAGRRDGGCGR